MEIEEIKSLTKHAILINWIRGLIFAIAFAVLFIFMPLYWAPTRDGLDFVYVSLYSILVHLFKTLGQDTDFSVALLAYIMPLICYLCLMGGLYLINRGVIYLCIIEQQRLKLNDEYVFYHNKINATKNKATFYFIVGSILTIGFSVAALFYYDLSNIVLNAFDLNDSLQYSRYSFVLPALIYINNILKCVMLVIVYLRIKNISEDRLDIELFK